MKSDKWDKREKERDPLHDTPAEIRKSYYEAIEIFSKHRHQKGCHGVQLKIEHGGKISKLKCKDCGWNFFGKEWWEFWK